MNKVSIKIRNYSQLNGQPQIDSYMNYHFTKKIKILHGKPANKV